jgi:rod shape-determining protein MreB
LSIGTACTAYQESILKEGTFRGPRGFLLPTVIGYPKGCAPGEKKNDAVVSIGADALARAETLAIVRPVQGAKVNNRLALVDFARRLRYHMRKQRKERPWGVVAYPVHYTQERLREFRSVVSELFERLILVQEPHLLAMGKYHELSTRSAILIDLGASATRFHMLTAQSPFPNGHLLLHQGGNTIDACIREAILRTYPDLLLTDATITQIKERLGFVEPVNRRSTLQITYGQNQRELDLSDILREACEILVGIVLEGLQKILSQCPSDLVEEFILNIFLTGGGARLRGLRERLQLELFKKGFTMASVKYVPGPQTFAAKAALRWALASGDDKWEIPLFSFNE